MSRRALFIVNPFARGIPSSGKLELAAAWLESQGWETKVEPTGGKGHATSLAKTRWRPESRLSWLVAATGR